MISNRTWDIFSLPYPHNKEKKWDILLHQSQFYLDYVKHYIKVLKKYSKVDQNVAQNLKWLGVYLRSTLFNDILWKVTRIVMLTATGPLVYVATTTTFLSNFYDALEDNLNHLKSIKLKIYPG